MVYRPHGRDIIGVYKLKPTNMNFTQKLMKLSKLLLKFSEIKTDKGVLTINEDLAEGVEVYVEDENGEFVPAADGEYVAEDSRITVEGGKVAKIEEVKAEEKPAEEKPAEEVKVEVKEEDTPAEPEQPQGPDEKDLRIQELEGLLKDRDAIIEGLNARIKELEDKIAKPVEEPVEMKSQADEKINDENLKINPALRYFQ